MSEHGPFLERLDPRHYRRTPWKNGGGVSIDIAGDYREGAQTEGWSGIVWRLGRTRIETPGPFSDLSGYDRVLTVIQGGGLVLKPAGRQAIDARVPFHPVAFPGEWPIESTLEQGGVGVLNLITDRRFAEGVVRFPAPNEEVMLSGEINILYAPAANPRFTLDGSHIELEPDWAARAARGATLRHASGILAVVSISLTAT